MYTPKIILFFIAYKMNVNYGTLDQEDVPAFQFTQQLYKKEADRGNVGDYEYGKEL